MNSKIQLSKSPLKSSIIAPLNSVELKEQMVIPISLTSPLIKFTDFITPLPTYFKLQHQDLYFLDSSTLFKYKNVTSPNFPNNKKLKIAELTQLPKDLLAVHGFVYLLYDKSVRIYKDDKFEFIYEIKTNQALSFIFYNEENVFIATTRKVFKILNNLILIEFSELPSDSSKIYQTLGFPSSFTMQSFNSLAIYDASSEDVVFSVEEPFEISCSSHLNDMYVFTYSKTEQKINVYDWQESSSAQFQIFISSPVEFDIFAQQDMIFLVNTEHSQGLLVIFDFDTQKVHYAELTLENEALMAEVFCYYNIIDPEKYWGGYCFIEVITGTSAGVSRFFVKPSLERGFLAVFTYCEDEEEVKSAKEQLKNSQSSLDPYSSLQSINKARPLVFSSPPKPQNNLMNERYLQGIHLIEDMKALVSQKALLAKISNLTLPHPAIQKFEIPLPDFSLLQRITTETSQLINSLPIHKAN